MFITARAALHKFISTCLRTNNINVLDIGAGEGKHANVMTQRKLNVTTNDIKPPANIIGPYTEMSPTLEEFDGIWCAHVLEHQRNVGIFLDCIFNNLKEGGILAISVPPRKDSIVGGHLTLWNAGILLYNLILARFDCKLANVATYHYNVSVVVQKKTIEKIPPLKYDTGDIETLRPYFPKGMKVKQDFNGFIVNHNWNPKPPEPPQYARLILKPNQK